MEIIQYFIFNMEINMHKRQFPSCLLMRYENWTEKLLSLGYVWALVHSPRIISGAIQYGFPTTV